MRDNNTLDRYPEVIHEMSEVVARGGFGTSVTPVSQFYFQQAYMNVLLGEKWKKIVDGYGNMVLGYFGKTPREPDPEIVKLASEQLDKPAFDGNPVDVLEPGIPRAEKILKENDLPVNDENIFIVATCGEKGVQFLKGEMSVSVYYKEEEKEEPKEETQPAPAQVQAAPTPVSESREFVITVNGQLYRVGISPTS